MDSRVMYDAQQATADYQNIVRPWLHDNGFLPKKPDQKDPIYQIGYGVSHANVPMTVDRMTRAISISEEALNKAMSNLAKTLMTDNQQFMIQVYMDKPGGKVLECMILPMTVLWHIYVNDAQVNLPMKHHPVEHTWFLTVPFSLIRRFCMVGPKVFYWWKKAGCMPDMYGFPIVRV